MSLTDRRDGDRRGDGRRLTDLATLEHRERALRCEHPAKIAMWLLQVERSFAADRRREARLRELANAFSGEERS